MKLGNYVPSSDRYRLYSESSELALMSVKLLLEVGLRIARSRECAHGDFEFPVAERANCNYRCHVEPFDDSKMALRLWIVLA